MTSEEISLRSSKNERTMIVYIVFNQKGFLNKKGTILCALRNIIKSDLFSGQEWFGVF